MRNPRLYLMLVYLIGVLLLFIGLRFIISPEIGETGYGLVFTENGNYSFHYIKGIRDVFSGLLFLILAFGRQYRALGAALLLGSIIPMTDAWIVLAYQSMPFATAIAHLSAIVLCLLGGVGLLRSNNQQNGSDLSESRPVKIINSARNTGETLIEMEVAENASTPLHYHNKFSETFRVLSGELLVTKNKVTHLLEAGDQITIERKEIHSFSNSGQSPCTLLVTLRPGSRDFETAMQVYNGLAQDGAARSSGIPARWVDLAVFLKLNDTHMKGLMKLGEWLLNGTAHTAERLGYTKRLINKYTVVQTSTDETKDALIGL